MEEIETHWRDVVASLPTIDTEVISSLCFIDIESSGLSADSYPTEFGSCGLDLKPVSFLVRPLPEWRSASWSKNAQTLTGITKTALERDGIAAEDGVDRISAIVAGKICLSDNPDHDVAWLHRLSPVWFDLNVQKYDPFERSATMLAAKSASFLELKAAIVSAHKLYPHVHRAGPDALRMAAMFKLLVDNDFREYLIGKGKQ